MIPLYFLPRRIFLLVPVSLLAASICFAGVSRAIQQQYRTNYENKALFLKLPIFSAKKYIYITGQSHRAQQETTGRPPLFKVGDQIRVIELDFGGDEIKFKLSAIDGTRPVEIIYQFDSDLQETFPNRKVFDSALESSFTEGLKYTDLEEAKRRYTTQQFSLSVQRIASSSGASREDVMSYLAPSVPAYQDAQRVVRNLENRNKNLAGQISQLQTEKSDLEAELRRQESEVSRLSNLSTSQQSKIGTSDAELTKLRDEVRNAQAATSRYKNELANVQRSLQLKVDANQDLAGQIDNIGQGMQQIRNENENLKNQNVSIREELKNEKASNTRLTREVDTLKASGRKMRATVRTLTSKEDSLARKYLEMSQAKENLENITLSVKNIRARVEQETSEAGIHSGEVGFYLGETMLGSLNWQIPEHIGMNQVRSSEAHFIAESIDYVRVAPEERQILQTLGDSLKLRVSMVSRSETMEIMPEQESPSQEVGERDSASWRWQITNRGADDSRIVLAVDFVNQNDDEIPVLEREQLVRSSNIVRQVRGYLQPIPLAVGALVGFLLFGIVGIFRRGKRPPKPPPSARPPAQPTYVKQKGL
jgi:hypothetical protein